MLLIRAVTRSAVLECTRDARSPLTPLGAPLSVRMDKKGGFGARARTVDADRSGSAVYAPPRYGPKARHARRKGETAKSCRTDNRTGAQRAEAR